MRSQLLPIVGLCLAVASPFSAGQRSANVAQIPIKNTPSASLPDTIELLRPSIVRIEVKYDYAFQDELKPSSKPTTGELVISGTGFIVDNLGHIGTAAHVVDENETLKQLVTVLQANHQHLIPDTFKKMGLVVSFPTQSSKHFGGNIGDFYNVNSNFNASILKEDAQIDIAVVALKFNPLNHLSGVFILGRPNQVLAAMPKIQTTTPRDGDMIAVSGFPLNIPVLVTNVGWIASSYFRDERNRSLYLASILINHGNSGGPVYNVSDGSILGCVVEYEPAPEGNSGLTVIVPIQRFLDLINSSNK